jgi:hypothetical protein
LEKETKTRQLEEWEKIVATHRWSELREYPDIRRRFEEMAEKDRERAKAEEEERKRKEERERKSGGVYRRIGDPPETFVVDVPITEVRRSCVRWLLR